MYNVKLVWGLTIKYTNTSLTKPILAVNTAVVFVWFPLHGIVPEVRIVIDVFVH